MRMINRFGPALLIVALALSIVTGCGRLHESAAELVAKAKEHINQNDYSSARIDLLNALQKDPDKVDARQLLATVSLELGDYASATKEIRKAMALGLPQQEGQPILVKALVLKGDSDQILTQTSNLPSNLSKVHQAMLLGIRGRALIEKGRLDEAKQTLEHALSLDEKSPEALIGMAVLYASQRQLTEANKWIDRALAAAPSSTEAWSTRGDIDLAQGKAAEAEKAFSKAIENRRYPSIDYAKRALARAQLKKFKDAQADIDKLRQAGAEKNPFVNYVAGVNDFYQKKYNDALTAFQSSAAGDPSFLPTNVYLATVQLMLGNTEQALTAAQRVYSQAPDSLTAARLIGEVQIRRSEYGEAKRVLQKALRESPDNGPVLRMLATISLLQGETAAAVKYSEQATALDPKSAHDQNMVMLAKLINGQALDENALDNQDLATSGESEYTREFLKASGAFRDRNIAKALERAQSLHKKYPDKTDPIKLMAACHLVMGNWKVAESELEQILKMSPDDPSTTKNLAKVKIQLGKLGEARTLLDQLLASHPGDEGAALLLSSVDSRRGDTGAAMRVLKNALRNNPGALAVRAQLANEYLRAGQVNKVIEITEDLNDDQFRKQPVLLELRGKAQLLSGNLAMAKSSFQQWTEILPESAQAHYFYGDSLARSGDADEARRELNRALKLEPNYLPARIGKIKLLALQGKMDAAKHELDEAKKNFGDRTEVLGVEGWLALQNRDYTKAADSFAAANKKQPSTELTLYLVQALWAADKHDQAIEVMQTWLKDNPRDVAVQLQLANAYLASKNEDAAIKAYTQVIKLDPNHVPSLNNLAWLNRERDPHKALEYAKRAYDIAPNQPTVLDTMGILLVKSGDVPQGLNMLRNAFERAPNNVEIGLHLARALIQQKKFDEARGTLKKLIDSAPASAAAEAKQLLASIKGN